MGSRRHIYKACGTEHIWKYWISVSPVMRGSKWVREILEIGKAMAVLGEDICSRGKYDPALSQANNMLKCGTKRITVEMILFDEKVPIKTNGSSCSVEHTAHCAAPGS